MLQTKILSSLKIIWRFIGPLVDFIEALLVLVLCLALLVLLAVIYPLTFFAELLVKTSPSFNKMVEEGMFRRVSVDMTTIRRTNKTRYLIALHEAGHAVVHVHSSCLKGKINQIGVRRWSRSRALGYGIEGFVEFRCPLFYIVSTDLTEQRVIEECSVSYAGWVATTYFSGNDDSTGSGDDFADVDRRVEEFVKTRFDEAFAIRSALYSLWLKAQARKRAREIIYRESRAVIELANLIKKHPGEMIDGSIATKLIIAASVQKVGLPG